MKGGLENDFALFMLDHVERENIRTFEGFGAIGNGSGWYISQTLLEWLNLKMGIDDLSILNVAGSLTAD